MALPRSSLAFLRSRRERLQPADVGLPPGSRRRTAGLRREEVALLASISPTYYTFLEQGRDVHPSRQVLDALARALRMTAAERAYLHELAGGAATAGGAEALPAGVAELVERLGSPAYVTGRRFDVLAANAAARTLFADWPAGTNLLRWILTEPAARTVYDEWEREAAAQLGRFRAAAARFPEDPSFAELIEGLLADSEQMRAWWPRIEVAPLGGGRKRLRGKEYRHVVLLLAEDAEQKLVTFLA
jgi:transcriptional regulator with XRE-family HTH domain